VSSFSEVYICLSIGEDDKKHQELVGSKLHMIRTVLENGKVVKN
jgi:hypothetical protein